MEFSAKERWSEGGAGLTFAARRAGRAHDSLGQAGEPSDLGKNLVLILGLPRSGTTWLAKIFDSHPGVVYRHEPGIVHRGVDFPNVCRQAEADAYRDVTRAYLARLVATRTLKTAGSLPIFAKEYQGRLRQLGRSALIYGLHALNVASRGSKIAERLPIPDFRDPSRRPPLCTVVKSVSLFNLAGFIANALPESRIVFLLRHPCGQVDSMMRGTTLGKLRNDLNSEDLLAYEGSGRLGLTSEALEGMPFIEHYAWRWALFCQKVLDDLRGRPNVRVVRYEDLCAEPVAETQELFSFADLPWQERTAAFIKATTRGALFERYYGVTRNSKTAADAWRSCFSDAERQRVLAITRQFEVGQYYPD